MLKKDVKSGQVQKKNVAKSNLESNLNKIRMERAIMQSDILQDKILKSKQRSKQVQLTRKQNWDAINQAANEVIRSRSGTPADNGEPQNKMCNPLKTPWRKRISSIVMMRRNPLMSTSLKEMHLTC